MDEGLKPPLSYQQCPRPANLVRCRLVCDKLRKRLGLCSGATLPDHATKRQPIARLRTVKRPTEDPRLLFEAKRFRVVEQSYQPDGGGPQIAKQFVHHPGAVVIVPMVDDDHVCLIHNYRLAVGETLVELPAGTIDPPEEPLTTASRELQEETGYTAERFRSLGAFFMSPGILNERMHVFAAEGLTPGDPAREPGEDIENLVVPWGGALSMATDGRIADAKSIAALFLWDRLRKR